MQLYVKAKSKKAFNEKLAQYVGQPLVPIYGYLYEPTAIIPHRIDTVPHGTVLKFYWMHDTAGNPIARSYGTWDAKKMRAK